MRKFVRFVGIIIIVCAFILGALIVMEAPMPQDILDIEASLALTRRGQFMSYGYALVNTKFPRGIPYTRYTSSIDDYQWGNGAHYDYLPNNSAIKIGRYVDGHIFACVNGMSVSIDEVDFMTPVTAEDVASNTSITENHVNDSCQLVIGKQYRDQGASLPKKWRRGL